MFTIVHTAWVPSSITTDAPVTGAPVHDHGAASYPLGPVSDSVYVPASTDAAVTGIEPVTPEIVVGPSAVSVHAVDGWVPPCTFWTTFTSVRVAGRSELVMVQVAVSPGASVTVVSVVPVAPSHTQLDAS